jgi:tetratricopeptide (TPR) repeat protein
MRGQTEKALDLFKDLRNFCPIMRRHLYDAAELNLHLGKRDEAVSFLHKALLIYPTSSGVYAYMADIGNKPYQGKDSTTQ